jgi:enamine deaminase RidA (YjgF/YER057c/UK114 family)
VSTVNTAQREVLKVPGAELPDDIPASPAVVVEPFVFVGSTSGSDGRTGLAEDAQPEPALPLSGVNPRKLEMRKIYERLGAGLEAGGSSFDRTVQINQWVASYHGEVDREPTENRNHDPAFFEHWREIVEPNLRTRDLNILEDRPASTCMPVDRLLCTDAHIEVEIVGVTRNSGIQKRAYEHDVHVPLGGYSIGIETGPWLFTAGFIATDFKSGLHPDARVSEHVWYGNQIAQEVDNVLQQLKVTVEAGNARWEDTVKAVLYVTPWAMRNLPAIDEVWHRHWPEDPPARALVPVSGVGMRPLNIEVNLIVARPDQGGEREVITTDRALAPLGHAAQAIKSGPLLFLSSQLGRDAHGAPPDTAASDRAFPFLRRSVKEQLRMIQENANAICEAAGTSLDQTVKANLLFDDFRDVGVALPVWAQGFGNGYPASGFFEAPPGTREVPGCHVTADLTVAV